MPPRTSKPTKPEDLPDVVKVKVKDTEQVLMVTKKHYLDNAFGLELVDDK